MAKLVFDRKKYGKELLIDAAVIEELNIVDNTLGLTFFTIIFLKKGEGRFYLDTEKLELSENQVIFIRPGQVSHKVYEAEFEAGIFLFFEAEFLDLFFNDQFFVYKFPYFHTPSKSPILKIKPEEFNKIHRAAHEIWEELQGLSSDSEHLLRSLLYYLLILLNRSYSNQYQTYSKPLANPHLLRFKKLLEKDIRSTHAVQDFADKLGVSRTYLNQITSKYLGRTSKEAISERLLIEAKKEIIFSKKDISEIAYDLNFKAPSHFTRFFKQLTGRTPLNYRDEFSKW